MLGIFLIGNESLPLTLVKKMDFGMTATLSSEIAKRLNLIMTGKEYCHDDLGYKRVDENVITDKENKSDA